MDVVKESYKILVEGPYVTIALIALLVFVAILVVINIKSRFGTMCLAISFMITSMLLLITGNFTLEVIKRFVPEYASLIAAAVGPLLNKVSIVGYVFLGLAVVCIVIGTIIDKKNREKEDKLFHDALEEYGADLFESKTGNWTTPVEGINPGTEDTNTEPEGTNLQPETANKEPEDLQADGTNLQPEETVVDEEK